MRLFIDEYENKLKTDLKELKEIEERRNMPRRHRLKHAMNRQSTVNIVNKRLASMKSLK